MISLFEKRYAMTHAVHCRAALLALAMMTAGTAAADPLDDAAAAYQKADYKTAEALLRPLAESGDAAAQLNLGNMYERGLHVAQDHTIAVEWYRKAANQGHTRAMMNLVRLNAFGDGGEAMTMLKPLADAGDADAQYAVGLMYRRGQGVPQDYATAMTWYRKAAEQGHVKAQTGLGASYRKGHGVEQNDQLALKWTRLGAEQGNADAQRGLGSIYAAGLGVTQDNVTALMWYSIAAVTSQGVRLEGGGSAAADRDALAARMTPEQISQAQKRADDWLRASHPREKP
jgi:TPR repeat protein